MVLIDCVGFDTPIDFKLGAIFDWLEVAQLVTKKVLHIYSKDFHVDDFGITESTEARVRAQKELALQASVLPLLDLNFMAMSTIEQIFSSHVFVVNSASTILQTRGHCTADPP